MINIALIGNPNAGKTTLYNLLTGSNQTVGNWPGVTVERKLGKLKSNNIKANVVDLPGIYSLSTISLEEEVASNYVNSREMDLIINIVDASNLERNLFLSLQLIETGIPMIIALNAMDIIEKNKESINYKELSKMLNTPVIPISASKKIGIAKLIEKIENFDLTIKPNGIIYNNKIESTLSLFNKYIKNKAISYRFFEDGIKAIDYMKIDKMDMVHLLQAYHDEKLSYDLDFDMVLPNARYEKILYIVNKIYKKSDIFKESDTDKIDKILTNKFLGLPIFGLIMLSIFFLAFGPLGTFITKYFVLLINLFFNWIASGIESLGVAPYITSLLNNGIVGGLVAVIGFLPQLAILFFSLSILEDSGYMSRAAFIMDRALKRFGLSGKSFIPMLMGFGCSVPAIASTRTLDRDEDRKITIMIIPFMSCGAKAPIYGVFAGALFGGGSYLIVFSMYLLGILVAIFSAYFFKKILFSSAETNYIMELPQYRMPTFRNTMKHTWDKSRDFLVKAGTVLLAAFIIIWFLSYFGISDGTLVLLDKSQISNSLLASIGRFILPLFKPIGFRDWEALVAMLTGIVAKESVVGTLGILYNSTGNVMSSIPQHFTMAQAYSFMTFALLSTPCIAAVAAMWRELKSFKWFSFAIAYEMTIAYVTALFFYTIFRISIGTLLTYFITVLIIIFVIVMVIKLIKNKGSACGDCSTCSKTSSCDLNKYIVFKEKISDNPKGDKNE